MDNTILIWKYILPELKANEELAKYVDEKYIYPLVALEGTPFPFIIYRRDSLVPTYTKHVPGLVGWVNNVSISISIWSDNYDEGVYIANIVRNIIEHLYISNEEISIKPIELANSNEYYSENGFEQRLTFNLTAE